MVIVTRDGVIIHADPLTEEQRLQGWKIVLSAYLKAHPEALIMNEQDSEDDSTGLCESDCPAHTENL